MSSNRPISVSKLSNDRKQPFERKTSISSPMNHACVTTIDHGNVTVSDVQSIVVSDTHDIIHCTSIDNNTNSVIVGPTVPSALHQQQQQQQQHQRGGVGIAESSPDHFSDQRQQCMDQSQQLHVIPVREDSGGGTSSSSGASHGGGSDGVSPQSVVTIQIKPTTTGQTSSSSSISSIPSLPPSLQPAFSTKSMSEVKRDTSDNNNNSVMDDQQQDISTHLPASNDPGFSIKRGHTVPTKDPSITITSPPTHYDSDNSSKRHYDRSTQAFMKHLTMSRTWSDEQSNPTLSEISDGERSYPSSVQSHHNQNQQIRARKTSQPPSHFAAVRGSNGSAGVINENTLLRNVHSCGMVAIDNYRDTFAAPSVFIDNRANSHRGKELDALNRLESESTGGLIGTGSGRRSRSGGIAAISSSTSVMSGVSMRSKTSGMSHATMNTNWTSASKRLLTLRDFRLDVSTMVVGQECTRKLLYIPNYLSESILGSIGSHQSTDNNGGIGSHSSTIVKSQRIENVLQTVDLDETEIVFYFLPSILRKELDRIAMFPINSSLDGARDNNYSHIKTQLFVFLRSTLIPFINQLHKRVLIIINNCEGCFLTSLFTEIALAEQAKDSTPCFQVLLCVNHVKNVPHLNDTSLLDPNRTVDLTTFREKLIRSIKKNQTVNDYDKDELNPVANVVLVAEVVNVPNDTHRSSSPPKNTQQVRIDEGFNAEIVVLTLLRWFKLIAKIPVIVFQGLEMQRSFHSLAYLASMDIPVLLLDSVNNAFTNSQVVHQYEVAITSPSSSRSSSIPTHLPNNLDLDSIQQTCGDIESNLGASCPKSQSPYQALNQDLSQRVISDAIQIIELQCSFNQEFMDTSSFIAILNRALYFASVISPRVHSRRGCENRPNADRDSKRLSQRISRSREDRSDPNTSTTVDECATESNISSKLLNEVLTYFHSKSIRNKESPASFINIVFHRNIYACSLYENQANIMIMLNSLLLLHAEKYNRTSSQRINSPFISCSSSRNEYNRIGQQSAKRNKLITNRLIQDTFQTASHYGRQAHVMKIFTKVIVSLFLLALLLLVLFSVLQALSLGPHNIYSVVTVSVSIFAIFVMLIYYVVNPHEHWQRFRIASLRLEAECWKFSMALNARVLKDAIAISPSSQDILPDQQESMFLKKVNEMKSIITISDGQLFQFLLCDSVSSWLMKGWSLVCKARDTEYGSHNNNDSDNIHIVPVNIFQKIRDQEVSSLMGLIDNVQMTMHDVMVNHGGLTTGLLTKPFGADDYLQYRVIPAVNFYHRRLTQCKTISLVSQIVVVGCAIFLVPLSFFNGSSWIPLVVAIICIVVLLHSLIDVCGKTSRYAVAIHSLEELVFNWNALDMQKDVEKLIVSCELILSREQYSWCTISSAMKDVR